MKSKLLTAIILFFLLTKIVWATDSIPPVITLNGPATMYLILNTAFTDPGATAWDNVDGNVSSNITHNANASNPNVNLAGTYTVIYSVYDLANNIATETRTIIVYNEANFFQCNPYYGYDSCLTSIYTQFNGSLTPSPTLNMHVLIDNFGAFAIVVDAQLGGLIVGSSINISPQTISGNAYLVSAHGMITNLSPLTFYIGYLWTDGIGYDSCVSTYVTQCFSSVDENNFNESFRVFPNPSTGLFTASAMGKHSLKYDIYNLQGQIVLSRQVNSNDETIDLSNQPTGIYFIRFITENGFITKKVLVER